MNAAVETAIAHLQEAREALNRALDDPTLTPTQYADVWHAYYEIHAVSLTLALSGAANRKQIV